MATAAFTLGRHPAAVALLRQAARIGLQQLRCLQTTGKEEGAGRRIAPIGPAGAPLTAPAPTTAAKKLEFGGAVVVGQEHAKDEDRLDVTKVMGAAELASWVKKQLETSATAPQQQSPSPGGNSSNSTEALEAKLSSAERYEHLPSAERQLLVAMLQHAMIVVYLQLARCFRAQGRQVHANSAVHHAARLCEAGGAATSHLLPSVLGALNGTGGADLRIDGAATAAAAAAETVKVDGVTVRASSGYRKAAPPQQQRTTQRRPPAMTPTRIVGGSTASSTQVYALQPRTTGLVGVARPRSAPATPMSNSNASLASRTAAATAAATHAYITSKVAVQKSASAATGGGTASRPGSAGMRVSASAAALHPSKGIYETGVGMSAFSPSRSPPMRPSSATQARAATRSPTRPQSATNARERASQMLTAFPK